MKKRQDDPPKGAPAWQSTFSDLMNLLLCFFVLLFSMSTVDAAKFQMVVASMQSSISIMPAGSMTIGEGELVGGGVSQLEFLDNYYNELANTKAEDSEGESGKNDVFEQFKEESLSESEEMAEQIQAELDKSGIHEMVDVDFTAEYVQLNLSGAILFDSGKSEIIRDALPIVDKIGRILENYDTNIIEIEGHTDNVPISSAKYENNDVLSMYRALSVADYLRETTNLKDGYIKSSGRGEYVPIADNSTAEGRARNRRVEIKIYNSYNSSIKES